MTEKNYQLALHIFRRDLRLQDNTALLAALKSAKEVLPCFIFDPKQLTHNVYKSENALQFMVTSLLELQTELHTRYQGKLYFFSGSPADILQQLLTELPIDAVFINRDYTPFSLKRDEKLAQICRTYKRAFHVYADALLQEPEQVLKTNRTPYTIFTPFFKKAALLQVLAPVRNHYHHYYQKPIALADMTKIQSLSKKKNPNLLLQGGRNEALQLLKKLKQLNDYENIRNFPALAGTTKLSAHNKFGTVSIREVYSTIVKYFGKRHTLITELYWRDFFTHIAFHYPAVFGHAFHQKYDRITWSNNTKHFRAWCEGQTGFPIVDAGMRELNITGFMHNRVRMITASFLTKDLHLDWRLGERYFAERLIDYDPAVNNGNWQWAASTGCDAQPYFRIFNPWRQQEKFDPECLYIKRFVPELARLTPKVIHAINTHQATLMTNYPTQIVDHAEASQKTKMLYQSI